MFLRNTSNSFCVCKRWRTVCKISQCDLGSARLRHAGLFCGNVSGGAVGRGAIFPVLPSPHVCWTQLPRPSWRQFLQSHKTLRKKKRKVNGRTLSIVSKGNEEQQSLEAGRVFTHQGTQSLLKHESCFFPQLFYLMWNKMFLKKQNITDILLQISFQFLIHLVGNIIAIRLHFLLA